MARQVQAAVQDQGEDFRQNGMALLLGLTAGQEGRDADVPDLGAGNPGFGLVGEGDDVGVVIVPEEFTIKLKHVRAAKDADSKLSPSPGKSPAAGLSDQRRAARPGRQAFEARESDDQTFMSHWA